MVRNVQFLGRLANVQLEDQKTPFPPGRTAIGVSPNTFQKGVPPDPFSVLRWLNEFKEACECVSGNYAGLPEAVDYFDTVCTDPGLPADMRNAWPFFVYHCPSTTPPFKVGPKQARNAEVLYGKSKKMAAAIAHTLKALHADGIVIRQLEMNNLRFCWVTRSYMIAEFFSLCRMGPVDADPHRPPLCIKRHLSAPECFTDGARLSPATDVFAIAALLLDFLGVPFRPGDPPVSEGLVINKLAAAENRFGFALKPEMSRAVKLALAANPADRPASMGQFLTLFSGGEIRQHNGPSSGHHGNRPNAPKKNPNMRKF